jgi:hypothetical protein
MKTEEVADMEAFRKKKAEECFDGGDHDWNAVWYGEWRCPLCNKPYPIREKAQKCGN